MFARKKALQKIDKFRRGFGAIAQGGGQFPESSIHQRLIYE